MNYHFDDFTLCQLIHLVKDQAFFLNEVRMDELSHMCVIPFKRVIAPNQDRYQLEVHYCVKADVQNPSFLNEDKLTNIIYESSPKKIIFMGQSSAIILIISRVEVSAIGSNQ